MVNADELSAFHSRSGNLRSVTILRTRPLVFVSSTIEELRLPRSEIEESLRALDLVDQWLFEFHAVAAGPPPDAQYLHLAASSDIFVLIIGHQMSEATREEYARAFDDNPHKILPFYVGNSNDDVREFRRLIDSRHSRVTVDDAGALVRPVTDAVEASVLDGHLLVPPLRRTYRDRLERLDALVGLDTPLSFVPYLLDGPGGSMRPQDLWSQTPRLVINGIGGAGKTYLALTTLYAVAADGFTLPLYLRWLRSGDDVVARAAAAFDAVRFQPGQELIERYCREGRLALCIDGIDDLRSSERIEALAGIAEFGERFPRVRIVVLARLLPDHALPTFERSEVAPLPGSTVESLFELQGFNGFQLERDVPKRIRDLVERPFWARVLATVGLDAETGLVVLDRLIEQRLRAVLPDEPRRQKLRAILEELALGIRPSVSVGWEQAIKNVRELWQEPQFATSFEAEPAEILLEQARATGLLDLEDEFTFIHPLIATMFAAEAAARRADPRTASDPELAAFIAGLLSEERHDNLLELLKHHDVFTLARALRLRPSAQRRAAPEEDAERYARTLRELGPLVSSEPPPNGVSILGAGRWLAVKTRGSEAIDLSDEEFSEWSRPNGDELAFVLWPENPFETALPEFVAAGEIVYAFKRNADRRLKVRTDLGPEEELEPLLRDQSGFAERALTFFSEWRDEINQLATETGLDRSAALTLPSGEPQLVLFEAGPRPPLLYYSWDGEPSFTRSDGAEPNAPAFDARIVLRNPHTEAARWLREQAERELGSALNSASWLRPELLAGWAW